MADMNAMASMADMLERTDALCQVSFRKIGKKYRLLDGQYLAMSRTLCRSGLQTVIVGGGRSSPDRELEIGLGETPLPEGMTRPREDRAWG
jgi:hypothetical protein